MNISVILYRDFKLTCFTNQQPEFLCTWMSWRCVTRAETCRQHICCDNTIKIFVNCKYIFNYMNNVFNSWNVNKIKTIIKLRIPQNAGNFSTWWASPGLFYKKLIFEVLVTNISSHCTNNFKSICIVYMFHHSQDLQMIAIFIFFGCPRQYYSAHVSLSKAPPISCSNKL